ncbi:3-oxoacid CoA-transferase subunit B [Pseudochelatococcus contaminans]|uniref:3-oxoacid CoA-transferase B subunit n=1 Tax=Pseudochelatococcus contaminans TaxID=1538103 RepID=A0A7W5Z257_9HYPH|nr:3-oxoacid CoA-transferase subunit B [Pseudochelatococcus contaminans]MBB3808676.1 3-oxoacid CoA-transferase B subunit [Pseudochelatococcus contaminans]
MEALEIIQRRVARELKPLSLVNLGIGLPTGVSKFVPDEYSVFFQSENGIIGMSARPPEGMEDEDLTDAGGGFVSALPGAATIDSAISFGLIRGGHVDATVLGGLEVDENGQLANWVVPGKMVPGMGGAMDLVTGARRVLVGMQHTARGRPKIVPKCTLPLTSLRRVTLIITDLAVIEPTDDGLVLRERAPDVSVETILENTTAKLIVPDTVPEMELSIRTLEEARRATSEAA